MFLPLILQGDNFVGFQGVPEKLIHSKKDKNKSKRK